MASGASACQPAPRPQASGGTAHKVSCSDMLQSAGQAPEHTRPSDHIASCTQGYISQDCEVSTTQGRERAESQDTPHGPPPMEGFQKSAQDHAGGFSAPPCPT